MAKRLFDTHKVRDPFYRNLPVAYRLFWDFICSECSHAGIWDVDMGTVEFYLGKEVSVDIKKALELFNTEERIRILEFDNGKKWYITSFISFQYGELNDKSRVHASVVKELIKYEELMCHPDIEKLKGIDRVSIGYAKGIDTLKDKDKDKKREKGRIIFQ